MRITRRSTAAVGLLGAIVLSQAAVSPAAAAEVPVPITFTQTSATLEYGEFWSFELTASADLEAYITSTGAAVVTSSGAPGGYTPQLSVYSAYPQSKGQLSAGYDVAPLGVGTYSFTISGSAASGGDTYTASTATPATLTVEKAKLGLELRVVADPGNPEHAIVTAKFTGRFVDEYQSSFFSGAALSPAGTWHITVLDESGEVATERSVERAAGDDVLATSFSWADAEPGQQYTASAEFVPSGASAGNFTVSAAQDFPFTAAETARPVPTSDAPEQPDAALPAASGFGLPLWALVLAIVLIAGLGALVTVLSVKLSRRPAAAAEGSAA